jgi:dTDP-4-dehydrorhamnose reductase
MSVLLFGATGFLGSHLGGRLARTMDVCAPRPRSGATPSLGGLTWLDTPADVADAASIRRAFDESGAGLVVNAIVLKSGSADELDAVNRDFPLRLASIAAARGARVVHISTDGVFSGGRGNYRETDVPDPDDAYCRSKLAGELAAPDLTLRTSFFGRTSRGQGLFEWLMAQRGPTVDGYTDYRFSGLAAPLLADLVANAIERQLEGVYHVGGDPMSKCDLLTAAVQHFALPLSVVPVTRGRVDRTLDSSRFFAALGRPRPTLAESFASLPACVNSSCN